MERCGFIGENEGKRRKEKATGEEGKRGKTRLAKGYLGLQGSDDESGTMDESEEPLPCGEDLESDCRRNRTKSGDSIVQSFKGRIAGGEEGDAKHGFL